MIFKYECYDFVKKTDHAYCLVALAAYGHLFGKLINKNFPQIPYN